MIVKLQLFLQFILPLPDMQITPYHAKYFTYTLLRSSTEDGIEKISRSLFDASVDLHPHQIDAALFALKSPLSKSVVLADEVGLGNTIEASLVLCQYWAERKRRLFVVCPVNRIYHSCVFQKNKCI